MKFWDNSYNFTTLGKEIGPDVICPTCQSQQVFFEKNMSKFRANNHFLFDDDDDDDDDDELFFWYG